MAVDGAGKVFPNYRWLPSPTLVMNHAASYSVL
jgi:hypothetical protein